MESINMRKCDHKINITIAHDAQRDFPTNQCYTTIINTDDNLNALQEFCIIKQWIFLYLNLTTISKQPKSLKELAHHSALSNAIPNPFSHIDGIICTDISQNFIKKVIFMKKVNLAAKNYRIDKWSIFEATEYKFQDRFEDSDYIINNYNSIFKDTSFAYHEKKIKPTFYNTVMINRFLMQTISNYQEYLHFKNGDLFILNLFDTVYDFLETNF
jgi:hypothetical protein